MPLWGTKDTVYSTGKVNVTTDGVVTKHSGAGLDFTASCKVGMVVTLADDGSGQGQGVISGITSATMMTLTNIDLPGAFSAVDYEVRESPIAEVKGGTYAIGEVFGVSIAEQQETVDDSSQYHPAHSGWVGITTYMQSNPDGTTQLRVKTEVLVANSTISGDSTDDTILPDS